MDETPAEAARAPAGPLWAARLLALAGFVDAAYLTAHHLAGTAVACGPGGGCEFVLTSRYATVGPVPVAAFGLAYYAVASLLAWTPPAGWSARLATAFLALVTAALGVTTVLVWIQAAVVDAWCRFCLVSAAITALLFVAALLLRRGVTAAFAPSARPRPRTEVTPVRFARTVRSALALVPLLALAATAVAQTSPVLVIHGGAGTAPTPPMAPERSAAYEAGLRRALDAGWAVLDGGGAALDAVEAAIRVLEDDSLFNAGVGAVFTHEGRNELDASLMDGATGKAGAVAGVTRIANPISLARLVMDRSPHVLLTGDGAEEFALGQGVALVPRGHFFTGGRWRDLQRTLERERAAPPAGARGPVSDRPVGTVGAVALDRAGRLAAGTSTGGMNNKRWGRVGDSPIIGAGTWADDRCAVSATGHGEFFIRNAVAHDICARVRYLEIPLVDAADQVVMDVLVAKGGEGGVIALGADGAVAMPFNSGAMFRAFRAEGREPVIGFLRE